MEQCCTLLVRHLPDILSSIETEDFLKHFGSQSVHVFPSEGRMRHCATATFPTYETAVQALHRLHQLEVFGRRLVVEYAKCPLEYHNRDHIKEQQHTTTTTTLKSTQSLRPADPAAIPTSNQESATDQRCQLCYAYPPPTPAIISNIAHVLTCVPTFYEQVLHLMNRMNLPAPFSQTPLFSLDATYDQWGERKPASDDSELESDDDNPKQIQPKVNKEAKRRKISYQKAKEAGPPNKKATLEQDLMAVKKIVLNVPQELSTDDGGVATLGGFGSLEPVVQPVEITIPRDQHGDQPDGFVTEQELRENRLSQNELSSHPAFRNYNKGDPTSRLYIKNLAKNVTEQDLTYIYGRYIDYTSEEHTAMFNVRLMTTGRMKGQAFIGLPSEDIALQAIKDTNGYQLKGKPIIAQFARSAKATTS
ncbi:RNA-binding region-containing protein 3-like [Dysidea avara]|uniref:RNA-binding region-containing protein 3-like n=1 Tax=Dysidea avara TaxID=196820 RepID=UPI00332C7CA1